MEMSAKIENIKKDIATRRLQVLGNDGNSNKDNSAGSVVAIPDIQEDKLFQEMLKIYEAAEADASVEGKQELTQVIEKTKNAHEAEKDSGESQEHRLLQEILRIYHLADRVLEIIGNSDSGDQKAQLEIATPYIEEAVKLADTVYQLFSTALEEKMKIAEESKETIEATFSTFFRMLHETLGRLEVKLAIPDDAGTEFEEEYIKPISPMAERFIALRSRTQKGTDGTRLVRARALAKDANTKLFIFSLEEMACHIGMILIEFDILGLAKFKRGYPAPGHATILSRKKYDPVKLHSSTFNNS
jgi:hypothetical protein